MMYIRHIHKHVVMKRIFHNSENINALNILFSKRDYRGRVHTTQKLSKGFGEKFCFRSLSDWRQNCVCGCCGWWRTHGRDKEDRIWRHPGYLKATKIIIFPKTSSEWPSLVFKLAPVGDWSCTSNVGSTGVPRSTQFAVYLRMVTRSQDIITYETVVSPTIKQLMEHPRLH